MYPVHSGRRGERDSPPTVLKMPLNGQNIFAGAYVDRHGHRREDAAWLREAARSGESRFVPVWGDRCLAVGEPARTVLLGRQQADAFIADERLIFLGLFRGQPAFAVGIDRALPPPFEELGQFHDLRYLGSILPADEANLVAHARALVIWHGVQQFCGRCGTPMRTESGGNSRLCTNDGCGLRIFPRVDPAIIVLVSSGDRCLLGRQRSWPEGRYSTIAGFVEPGESLEDAVMREVQEETNVIVDDVRYHSSQPWPFPSSLMLGFTAAASTGEIALNDGELEDARWFTRKELASGFPKLPPRLSISRRLVDDWLHAAEGQARESS
ncbi:MAG: NAD(+) diphosphatase [Gammaproteobacteria bacterium]|nr:NAD(+) diphosphatase [Gammaproteobacteria bacterium]MDH4254982.1 NAD(+) diphosphatase [Gammaproteobacteria bacterium]